MRMRIPEEAIFRLADASRKSLFRSAVAQTVSKNFRSIHYLSSKLICDCVTLNLVLNDEITPKSADEIITCIRRRNISMYTTIDSAFFPIEDKFNEYAKSVLGDNYDEIRALDLRITNYIVYVISLDVKNNNNLDSKEVYLHAYSYEELENIELPHY
ncbi:MAG: hypothetical protein HDT28_03830 [Clostridiales bacterium]|nr:hypothetical protein [Clostridiales bacterium]